MQVCPKTGRPVSRRQALFAAGAAAAFPYHLYAGTTKKSATDRVTLGPKKIALSRMAMGSGTNGVGGSSNQTRKLGMNGFTELIRAGFDQGITFWDTADQYGTHPFFKQALKNGIARDKVTLMSKTRASTEKEMRADIDRFRRELGTDYLDILLLHCMLDDDWTERKKGAMAVISEMQEKGIVRTKGTSCHTLGSLKVAAKTPWVEVDLARFNAHGIAMDSKDPQVVLAVLKEMKAAGKGIIGMKVLGAGKLRDKVDEALQYNLAHSDVIDCFTIGSESRAELEDLLRKIPAASVRG
ncbi:MAG: aldo/keto reductase [Bryobacteraceae bacterium]|nr:aldo/keto reductase [Bryobacteraceae bacterium]